MIGRQLSRQLLSPIGNREDVASLGTVVLSILLGELQDPACLELREGIEHIAVAYLAFMHKAGPSGEYHCVLA